MEMSQGNSLHSYHKQIKMLFIYLFTKSENRRAEQVLSGGLVLVGGGGCGERMNMVQILCTNVSKWRN
jgi:hypothetical protein